MTMRREVLSYPGDNFDDDVIADYTRNIPCKPPKMSFTKGLKPIIVEIKSRGLFNLKGLAAASKLRNGLDDMITKVHLAAVTCHLLIEGGMAGSSKGNTFLREQKRRLDRLASKLQDETKREPEEEAFINAM
ncbi:hypothetical protein FDECE_17436, partial [Fusarium decemcellulare]